LCPTPVIANPNPFSLPTELEVFPNLLSSVLSFVESFPDSLPNHTYSFRFVHSHLFLNDIHTGKHFGFGQFARAPRWARNQVCDTHVIKFGQRLVDLKGVP
jgi:hypothetical protein